MRLSVKQWNTIIHALRVAAEQFDRDMITARDANNVRLRNQFHIQAQESRQLADCIENNAD